MDSGGPNSGTGSEGIGELDDPPAEEAHGQEPLPVAAGDAGATWIATRYGVSYQGQPLGCGAGFYDTTEPSTVAIGPDYSGAWACGTQLRICGRAGCILGIRVDYCPGCVGQHIDLSEAGLWKVCGDQADICTVEVEEVTSK